MLRFTKGNLLHAETEAVVNTVNTVGVMGKGIALAFKETYPAVFAEYEAACKAGTVTVGQMLVTENLSLNGPRWIINFPTKKHWRHPSKLEWIRDGLADLKRVLRDRQISSISLPPLGCGNGGLEWSDVRPLIEAALGDLSDVEVVVYEPTLEYHSPPKRSPVSKLTPARALVAESVRRYSILGIDCTYLEVQKLAYFLERSLKALGLKDPLRMAFKADKYGPYSDRLRHLLDGIDGSYLESEKRLADAGPLDLIRFKDERREEIQAYLLGSEAREFSPVLDRVTAIIDGFESPLGMELLATVDWLLSTQSTAPSVEAIRYSLNYWPDGPDQTASERRSSRQNLAGIQFLAAFSLDACDNPTLTPAAARKQRLFDDRLIRLALERLAA